MSDEFFIFRENTTSVGNGLCGTKPAFGNSISINPKKISERYDILHSIVESELIKCVPNKLLYLIKDTKACGVYALFYKSSLVYMGSTTSGLRERLGYHKKSIIESNIELSDMTYRYAYCYKHSTRSVESCLIDYYSPEWNCHLTGFGSKQRFKEPTPWECKYGILKKSLYNGGQQKNEFG